MFFRNKKTRKYQTPSATVTHMALERNICSNVQFQIEVNPLDNVNAHDWEEEGEYFNPLES